MSNSFSKNPCGKMPWHWSAEGKRVLIMSGIQDFSKSSYYTLTFMLTTVLVSFFPAQSNTLLQEQREDSVLCRRCEMRERFRFHECQGDNFVYLQMVAVIT